MKTAKKYYFFVEGETEKWYLEWLQDKINNEPSSKHKVSIDCKIQKNPLKRAKSINTVSKIEITHLFDYESNDEVHTTQFKETLDALKKVSTLGKQIKYRLGYSNFAFELWIVLHKADCNGLLVHRHHYLDPINRAYQENFESLAQYKHENNFKRVLSHIYLSDVRAAISRSKAIMQRNVENGYQLQQYKNYYYYRENPALSVWESIEKILKDCDLD
ncbi:MAG: RloB domain-containing protein [Bacillota bacterium]|nr:RloB domain-containing protein [Bacillota bacterium]